MEFFTQTALLAAGAVLITQQILKLKALPVGFANKYPVPTNIVLSIVAAIIVKWQDLATLTSVADWLVFIGVVAVVAAIVYNQLIGKWAELRSMEGEGTK